MSETLARRDAFADLDATLPGATLTPDPPAARLILRASAAAAARAGLAFGLVPPAAPRAAARNAAGRRAIWLGPDEWLLVAADRADADALFGELSAALGGGEGPEHALFDVGLRQAGFTLAGAKAATILSGGCPLDLDPVAFPVDTAARTLYRKTEITLTRDGAETFHVEVLRSFLPYLLAHMRHAATGAPD